ncbi:MAG: hypothetical protein L6422_08825, partial [Candidatus Marinimicrobia bacterium]|nr:hypothetical protein [Candidatus Neomarinimicrobiota bacterium]
MAQIGDWLLAIGHWLLVIGYWLKWFPPTFHYLSLSQATTTCHSEGQSQKRLYFVKMFMSRRICDARSEVHCG